MINIIKGDLLAYIDAPQTEAIAHGCNCFCKMGAGVASKLVRRVPQVYTVDLTTKAGDVNKLGNFTKCVVGGIVYYNLYTQYYYGRVQVNFDIMSFKQSFSAMITDLKQMGKCSVHMPKIGSGLAKGDWDAILECINTVDIDLGTNEFIINIIEWE